MQLPFAFFLIANLGMPELLVIVFIIIVLFGGKRLGDIGKGLGEGIRNFKTSVKDEKTAEVDKNAKPSA
jgi:sec-independent protein translocase protein TatA